MSLNLRLRGDVWQVQGTVKTLTGSTVRVRKSTGFTKPEKRYAQVVMSKIMEDAMTGRLEDKSGVEYVADACDAYISRPSPPGDTDVRTVQHIKSALGRIKLSKVTLADFTMHFATRGVAANTLAREMTSANAMLNHARAIGMDVPDINLKKPSYDDARTRWLYKEEMEALIDACPDEIKSLVAFLFFTGARLGEATALLWRDVVDDSAIFSSRKGRSKKIRRRSVKLSPYLLSLVGERQGSNDYVFTNTVGSKWDRSNFYSYFRPACESAHIEDFTPHDCRHTFASHLVQKGASLRAVADLLGHSSLQMVMRYAHLAPSHLESTVSLLWDNDTKETHTHV